MTRIQKLILIRFIIAGVLCLILGFYFMIHPKPGQESYKWWIPIVIGNVNIIFSITYYWYHIVKKRNSNKNI